MIILLNICLFSVLNSNSINTYLVSVSITDEKLIDSINRPTKREKEKSPSGRHYQYEKEMGDHLLVYQQFLKESHIVTYLANERASFLKITTLMTFHFFERLTAIIFVL
jgi:hypothetical protein